jgi:sarcosine oxidase subunit alpha
LDVTEQWAAMAVAGPKARDVLGRVSRDLDLSEDSLGHMGLAQGKVAGAPARIFRISFSGERAYEVNIPASAGTHVWDAIMAAGEADRIVPYGLEAMATLRIEKGYPAGNEINGRVTADDLGLGKLLRRDKDYIGARSLGRAALKDAARRQLVGLMPEDNISVVPRGAQIVADPHAPRPTPSLGEVTSRCISPVLGKPIALGLVVGGRSRHGERLYATSPIAGISVPVVVTDPVFVDPQGERLRA